MAFDITKEMRAIDSKDRDFLDNMTEEERKKVSTYLMMRWGASISGSKWASAKGDADLQAYYLMACNENVNKNFFDLGKHPKLQWLLLSTVSPGMGSQFHYWVAPKKGAGDSKAIKFLTKIYPHAKLSELEMLAKINTMADLKQMAKDMGYTPEQLKKELG